MRIDLVSDIVCPWCYVGRRRLAAALAARPGIAFEVHWHPFELNPDLPDGGVDRESYWRRKFGDPSRLAEMVGRLVETGLELEIEFDFPAIKVQPNTRRAHELMHLAGLHGRGDDLAEALFRGYFVEGRDIGDPAVLAELAESCGLPAQATHATLVERAHAATVDEHLRQVREAAVTAVPTFILAGRHAFSGAQPEQFLLEVIDHLAAAEA
jgi:predicted DsbA family dithiol-disulfide isomerase